MAKTDPRHLRPSDLVRALNSTPLGEVVSERQLYRHRMRAGFRIGDGRHIDMLRYAAWLVDELERRLAVGPVDPKAAYEATKARAAARNAELARAGQDIGELAAVVNPERKARATGNFRFFCETYFPEIFYLPWSRDHHRVIDKIERAVLNGGLFAMAMPRGSGKTVLCQTAVLWAALVGATPFVCLIAASADRAIQLLETIKTWLETNPLLHEDWPEVTHPIRNLERITNRQKGQRYHGEPTRIEWNADKIVMPTIAGSRASGVVISCSGMKGSDIRGQNHARADGQVVRPQLAMVDDPQTTESAWSPSQSQRREAILAGDVLGMAGPGKKIAGLMCCTVIRPGDMADNMLDREKHPEWQGERTKLVYAFPVNEKLWARYAEIRADSLRNDGDGREATDFYAASREEMDSGAVIAWPERYNDDELSAIQNAMNLKLRDEAAFFAEYQNEPLVEEAAGTTLTADEIAGKLNNHNRGQIPLGASHLTMFIDVQARLLFYVVTAWEDDFTGYVVDYGTWPDQQRQYFTLRDARRTLERVSPHAGRPQDVGAGVTAGRSGGSHLRRARKPDE
ncbi:MAG: phage terminase large subunit family protein [Planctomycetota bacterium]|nr:phage terminase large subunit family protein [Planctomycetota bacterium]